MDDPTLCEAAEWRDYCSGLIDCLDEVLPRTITTEDAHLLVDSMRGNLGWAEPWLYREVISPLFVEGRISADDLCGIWVKDLLASMEQALRDRTGIFKRSVEGKVTEVAAFLFGHSGIQQQKATIDALSSVLTRVRRDVQQPLAIELEQMEYFHNCRNVDFRFHEVGCTPPSETQ